MVGYRRLSGPNADGFCMHVIESGGDWHQVYTVAYPMGRRLPLFSERRNCEAI
jgi:hypothetical protein